jgi:hypothetical protein
MSFFIARLILALYYIRPQDWVPGMSGWNIMKPVALIGVIGLFNRPQGLDPRSLFSNPIDWAVLLYGGYVVLSSDSAFDTLKAFYPFIVYFLLTSQGLANEQELTGYLKLWAVLLLILAGLAVASLFGFDLTGGRPMTELQKGRLALGTYMHSNPNALGHSVAAAIPLVYVFWFSKQPIFSRLLAVLACWLVYYCIEQTQSRGSFVVCAAAMLLSFSFGKPKFIQVFIAALALITGGSLVAIMPRMAGGLRSDEGVQGRMLAWEQARTAMQSNRFGVGYERFTAYIRWREGRFVHIIPKATHGSYIKIGADLGYPGLFFYLLIFAACIRSVTLRIPPSKMDILRRARDALFLSLTMTAFSGWMIDRAYHLEFFLLAGAISVYHRLLLQQNELERTAEASPAATDEDIDNPRALSDSEHVAPLKTALPSVAFGPGLKPHIVVPSPAKSPGERKMWSRLGLIELAAAAGLTYAVVAVWERILASFLW